MLGCRTPLSRDSSDWVVLVVSMTSRSTGLPSGIPEL